MGTHQDVDVARHESFEHSPTLLSLHGSRKEFHTHRQIAQKFTQGVEVLLSQDLRRCHDARLTTIVNSDECHHQCHECLTTAHIPLQESVHLSSRLHVGTNLTDDTFLSFGQLEGQMVVEEAVEMFTNGVEHDALVAQLTVFHIAQDVQLHIKQFLEFQSELCMAQRFR